MVHSSVEESGEPGPGPGPRPGLIASRVRSYGTERAPGLGSTSVEVPVTMRDLIRLEESSSSSSRTGRISSGSNHIRNGISLL